MNAIICLPKRIDLLLRAALHLFVWGRCDARTFDGRETMLTELVADGVPERGDRSSGSVLI